jgi:D-alanyl-D-alanine carboxypeptidase (penicillin-binding protein 5/6)
MQDRSRFPHYRFVGLLLCLLTLVALAGCSGTTSDFIEPSHQANIQAANPPLTKTIPIAMPTFHLYAGTLPAPPVVGANEAVLLNPATDTIYLADNADKEMAMASTTKIMTAYVALTVGQLDQPITVGADANGATLQQEYNASVAGLHTGDVLSLRDLLYALLLPSGDDAAIAIADGIAGSQQNYVALMNLEAGLLGLRHTHYANVHGLDATNHYTTARDLARLATIAMQNPTFAQIVSTTTHQVPATADHGPFTWHTTNDLLTPVPYPGAIGIKTGFTENAGGCLVFAAQRPYGELIGVLMGEPVENNRFPDAVALLDWGFSIEQQAPPTATPTATTTPAAATATTPTATATP